MRRQETPVKGLQAYLGTCHVAISRGRLHCGDFVLFQAEDFDQPLDKLGSALFRQHQGPRIPHFALCEV